ncbi:hypothetical protein Tco_1445358, partial [Tanacetum coccineum]
ATIIHNCSAEWLKIKEVAEKVREATVSEADEVGQVTCSKLLEALELSRYLYPRKYISPTLHLQFFIDYCILSHKSQIVGLDCFSVGV